MLDSAEQAGDLLAAALSRTPLCSVGRGLSLLAVAVCRHVSRHPRLRFQPLAVVTSHARDVVQDKAHSETRRHINTDLGLSVRSYYSASDPYD